VLALDPASLNLAVVAGALAIDAAFGYPAALFRVIRHPVVWFGAVLSLLDRNLNRPEYRTGTQVALGVCSLCVLLAVTAAPAALLQALLSSHAVGVVLLAVLASALPAQRSLWSHVRAVADGLERDGLAGGRRAVSHIVGRDPEGLDEAAVVRAAIESLAENFSDGVVAPAFWGAVLGLPGMAAYKAANTADSMVGHRTERHRAFGWASARFDDLVNLPASRLAVLFLVLASCVQPGADPMASLRAVWRDAGRHRSPNAGWPEAAMAGALGLRLAGPRSYGGVVVQDGWMGDGRAAATVSDLRSALALYRLACGIELAVVVLLWAALSLPG